MTHDTHAANLQDVEPPATISKRERAKFLTEELKSSVRSLLHHDSKQSSDLQDEFFEDAAFDPQRVLNFAEPVGPSMGKKLNLGARNLANTLKNPKAVGRNNYTRQAAAKIANHPHDHSNDLDNELLDAYQDLANSQLNVDSPNREDVPRDSTLASETVKAQSRVDHIEQQRNDLRTGWTLGRQVVRVKAVRHTRAKPHPPQSFVRDSATDISRLLQLGSYLGQLFLWYTDSFTAHRIDDYEAPPFDLSEFALTIERVAAVSTPWQTLFFELREIYLWNNPRRTAKYMVAYWVLWYLQQLTVFGIAFIIYKTIRNKLSPVTVQTIRERVRRSTEQSSKVRAWGELIQKHGGSDWVEPLIDGIGPLLQMQLSDLSSFLERAQNFYQWEKPRQTWLTMALFSIILLFLSLVSTETCVSLLWLILGCCFFYGFPIATKYPRYRHLVSPACWIFWLIPDGAELAILQLQQKVNSRDNDSRDQSEHGSIQHRPGSTQTEEPDTLNARLKKYPRSQRSNVEGSPKMSNVVPPAALPDILEFQTILLPKHASGRVVLTRQSIEFDSQDGPPVSFPYTSILEIRKVKLTSDSTNKLSRTAHMCKSLEKSANIQISPDGLAFIFPQENIPSAESSRCSPGMSQDTTINGYSSTSCATDDALSFSITLVLNKTDRDKLFTVVLAWSGMQWQPLYSMNRQNKLGMRRNGGKPNNATGGEDMNANLDDAIKRALV